MTGKKNLHKHIIFSTDCDSFSAPVVIHTHTDIRTRPAHFSLCKYQEYNYQLYWKYDEYECAKQALISASTHFSYICRPPPPPKKSLFCCCCTDDEALCHQHSNWTVNCLHDVTEMNVIIAAHYLYTPGEQGVQCDTQDLLANTHKEKKHTLHYSVYAAVLFNMKCLHSFWRSAGHFFTAFSRGRTEAQIGARAAAANSAQFIWRVDQKTWWWETGASSVSNAACTSDGAAAQKTPENAREGQQIEKGRLSFSHLDIQTRATRLFRSRGTVQFASTEPGSLPSDYKRQSKKWHLRRLTAAPLRRATGAATAASPDHPRRKQHLPVQALHNTSLHGDLVNNLNIIKYDLRLKQARAAGNPTPLCQVSRQLVLNHANREARRGNEMHQWQLQLKMTISHFSDAPDDQGISMSPEKRDGAGGGDSTHC